MVIHDKEAERFSKRLEMKSSWVLLSLSNSVLWPEELQSHLAYSRRFVHYCTQQARKSCETQEAEKSQSNVLDDDWPLCDDFFMTPLHSPKSENYGMPDEAEKSQSNVPDDNESNLTPFHPSKSEEHGMPDEAEESQSNVPDAPDKAEKSHSNVPDADYNLTPFNPLKSKNYGMPDKAERSQSNVPDEDSNLTPFYPLKYRKRGAPDKAKERRASFHSLSYGTAALVLFLLTFSARMCPVSGTMCEEMAVNKGEVGIVCLLTSNVYKTRQSVMIKSFKPSDYPEDVLECDWKSSEARFHCMHTQFRTQLIAIRPDRVLARLPKDRLENVTYRCQLVPPDPEPFTDCDICDPDDAKAVPRTEAAPGTLPTTLGHRGVGARRNEKPVSHSREPKPQVSVHSAGGQLENGGLVAAVVILSIIVFCLLLAIAAMMVFFLHYIQMIPGKNKTDKRKPEEANGFIV